MLAGDLLLIHVAVIAFRDSCFHTVKDLLHRPCLCGNFSALTSLASEISCLLLN